MNDKELENDGRAKYISAVHDKLLCLTKAQVIQVLSFADKLPKKGE